MLSHESGTSDRAVQRSRFSDGTEVIVHFRPQPYLAKPAGKEYVLPQNEFAVKGRKIEPSLARVKGWLVTSLQAKDYQFTDAK